MIYIFGDFFEIFWVIFAEGCKIKLGLPQRQFSLALEIAICPVKLLQDFQPK